jgi:hypothetical protein
MPFPQDVIVTALYEAAVQNGWKSNKSRVKEYIRTSRGRSTVPDDPTDPSMSWCGDFVYWVLAQANVQPLPEGWALRPKPQGSNAISRYTQLYQRVDVPEPGDLYYMPINPKGVQKDHIGIVYATNEWPANFISIDGNTDGNLGANWARSWSKESAGVTSPRISASLNR